MKKGKYPPVSKSKRKGTRVTNTKKNPYATFDFSQENNKDIEKEPEVPYLYKLEEVLDARTLFIVEEKITADCLNKVLQMADHESAIATTVLGGNCISRGIFWKGCLKQNPEIANKKIRVLPDNSKTGKYYARTVAAIILKVNPKANVKIVSLPDLPKDGNFVSWYSEYKEEKERKIAAQAMKAFGELCKQAEVITPDDTASWYVY